MTQRRRDWKTKWCITKAGCSFERMQPSHMRCLQKGLLGFGAINVGGGRQKDSLPGHISIGQRWLGCDSDLAVTSVTSLTARVDSADLAG